jgi:hypothetical protein
MCLSVRQNTLLSSIRYLKNRIYILDLIALQCFDTKGGRNFCSSTSDLQKSESLMLMLLPVLLGELAYHTNKRCFRVFQLYRRPPLLIGTTTKAGEEIFDSGYTKNRTYHRYVFHGLCGNGKKLSK